MKELLPTLVLLLLCGCTSIEPKLVSADAVPVYGASPMVHTAYVGSDEKYHYFVWSRGFRNGEVKVEKGQLKLSREFPRRTGSELVGRSRDGRLDVVSGLPREPLPAGLTNLLRY